MRLELPPVPIGDLGSTLGVRETDSCWTMRVSIGSLVYEHNWSCSMGTRVGDWRTLAPLVGTPGAGTDRRGACEVGEWSTEER
jgi:hypothetical protein